MSSVEDSPGTVFRSEPAPVARNLGSSWRGLSFLAVLAVVALAGVMRFAWLTSVPPAINQDEAIYAYEANCLRATGTDHWGTRWPIFFRGYGKGNYPPGTYIYALLPVQAVFGMTVWSTRLPAAALGTLNVLLLFLLVKRLYGHRAGLLAALLLAVSPWHVHLSRLGFEVSLYAPLITLGFLLIAVVAGRTLPATPGRGSEPGSSSPDLAKDKAAGATSPLRAADIAMLLTAGIVLGLAVWTYNAMRVFVPLLLLAGLLLHAGRIVALARRPRGWAGVLAFVCGFALALTPFLWSCATMSAQVWARAFAMSGLENPSRWELATEIIKRYAIHFSPSYLFLSGDASLTQSVPGYGQLHLYCAVLVPLGVYRVLRGWRSDHFGLLVLCWILLAPIPAALARLDNGTGHALRSAGALPAFQILAALGLEMALLAAYRYSRQVWQAAVIATAGIMAGCVMYFAIIFVVKYPPVAASDFNAEWPAVFREVKARHEKYDAVVLPFVAHGGMLYLFASQTDPREYFATPHRVEETPETDYILNIGNVYFEPRHFFREVLPTLPSPARLLLCASPSRMAPGGVEVARFRDSNDKPLLLYEYTSQRDE